MDLESKYKAVVRLQPAKYRSQFTYHCIPLSHCITPRERTSCSKTTAIFKHCVGARRSTARLGCVATLNRRQRRRRGGNGKPQLPAQSTAAGAVRAMQPNNSYNRTSSSPVMMPTRWAPHQSTSMSQMTQPPHGACARLTASSHTGGPHMRAVLRGAQGACAGAPTPRRTACTLVN